MHLTPDQEEQVKALVRAAIEAHEKQQHIEKTGDRSTKPHESTRIRGTGSRGERRAAKGT